MLARHYQSEDAPVLDTILGRHGDTRLDRDRITVVGAPGRPVGCCIWRPGGLVHELHCGHGLAQRHIADLLVTAAITDSVSRPFNLWEAVFVTDSDKVAEYVKGLGAVEEVGKRIFTMGVRQ